MAKVEVEVDDLVSVLYGQGCTCYDRNLREHREACSYGKIERDLQIARGYVPRPRTHSKAVSHDAAL